MVSFPLGGGAEFVVVYLLAIVLLIAAFAKAAAETTQTFGPIAWEFVAGVEAAAGILLVAFRRSSMARAAVGTFFLILAGVAFAAAWRGLPSCNCLGELPLAPWKMLALDLFAGTWLLASAVVLRPTRADEVDRAALRARLALGLAALAAVAVTGGAGGAAWVEHVKEASKPLRVDSKQLALGTMWLTEEKIRHQLTITNTAASELTVALGASCACTEVEPGALKLGPGQSTSVRLTIDPFKIARENWSARRWPIAIDVTAIGPTAKDQPGKWTITGDMLSPFLGYPTADVESITLWRTDSPSQTGFDVQLARGVSARAISAASPGTSCEINLSNATRPRVTTTIDPSACEPRTFLARGLLELSDSDGRPLPELPLEVPVTVRATVQLDPCVVLFREAKPATVRVRSLNGTPFRIARVADCDVATIVTSGKPSEYAREHGFTVAPLSASRSLAVNLVEFEVQSDKSALIQRLTLRIQPPPEL